MKALSPAIHLCAAAVMSLASTSCGAMKIVNAAKEKASSGVSSLADASWGRLNQPKVPVVEVRESELKERPTGEEQALAFESKRKRSFWGFFSGPVDFKEPTLPASTGGVEGSLLPPLE